MRSTSRERSEAIHRRATRMTDGLLRCARNDVVRSIRLLPAARCARGFASVSPSSKDKRARGKPGADRTRGRAAKKRTSRPQGNRIIRLSPRNGLRLILPSLLPGEIRTRFALHRIDASVGRRNTISPSAPVRQALAGQHRGSSANQQRRSPDAHGVNPPCV